MDTEQQALLQAELLWLRAAVAQARALLENVPPLMPGNSNYAWHVARELLLRETETP